MAVLTADNETGVNGNSLATTDTGSLNAWSSLLGTAACVYDNTQVAHGSLAAKITGASTSKTIQWSSAVVGTQTDLYGRSYIFLTANPSATCTFARTVNAGTNALNFQINTTGKIRTNNGATGLKTSTNSVALNQWIRVEWHFTLSAAGAGVCEVVLYNSADSTTATETLTNTALTTQASIDTIQFGQMDSTTTTSWQDQYVGNATAYPGPFPVISVAPTVSGLAPVGSTLTCDGGTWNGTFTLGYQWTRDGANIASATSSTYVTQAADATHAIGCTVTATGQQATNEAASSTSSNTITATSSGGSLSTVVGKTGTSGTAVMQKAASGWTYITGKTGTSGTAVDQKGAGSFTKIKGH